MKRILSALLVLHSCYSFSQARLEYGDFIQLDNNIQWAAETDVYLNLAAKTPKYSIKNWYLQKLKDSSILTYNINPDGYSVSPRKLTWDNFKKINPENFIVFENPFLKLPISLPDSNKVLNATKCSCDNCDKLSFLDLFRVKQILYYSQGKLNIRNILITPLCFKDSFMTTERTIIQNWNGLFNVAFNNSKQESEPIKDFITLGTETKIYQLQNISTFYLEQTKILTTREPNLIERIIRDAKSSRIKLLDPIKNALIPKAKIDFWGMEKLAVTLYDSLGNDIGVRYIAPERNYDLLNKLKIEQELVFDRKKEVLYSRIKTIYILEPVVTSSGIALGDRELFKILPSTQKK